MKRIGFDYVDPTPKPETSFHAPLLPQPVQGWGLYFCFLITRRTGRQNSKYSLNDMGFWFLVIIAFVEQNIYSLFN
jgi:hypothetical protein